MQAKGINCYCYLMNKKSQRCDDLKCILKKAYPRSTVILTNNTLAFPELPKSVPCRPLYHIPAKKLVVFSDGIKCFTDCKTQLNNDLVNKVLLGRGYTVIRIPYFLQLSPEVIQYYFNKTIYSIPQRAKQGFNNGDVDIFNFNTKGFRILQGIVADLIDNGCYSTCSGLLRSIKDCIDVYSKKYTKSNGIDFHKNFFLDSYLPDSFLGLINQLPEEDALFSSNSHNSHSYQSSYTDIHDIEMLPFSDRVDLLEEMSSKDRVLN